MSDPFLAGFTDPDALARIVGELQQKGGSREINSTEMRAKLKDRVKGQDHIISDLTEFIRRRWSKESRSRPIASLVFLGPPGTGKTELGKALTEYLYEDENNMVRFDGNDLSDPNTKVSLIGGDPIYSGSAPGRLTQPVAMNPKRVVLFDEVDKAHASIYDLFLTMMGEGRLTDQYTNKVANFTQSIIILTANKEQEAVTRLQETIKDPEELNGALKEHLTAVRAFRPEIINRFDRVYVFKQLKGMDLAAACARRFVVVCKEHNLELVGADARLIGRVMEKWHKLKDNRSIRDFDRIIDEMFDDHFQAAKKAGIKKFRLEIDEQSDEAMPCEID